MSLWRQLQEIHVGLKGKFTYMSDLDRYGKREYWARPNESMDSSGNVIGDCEDFALAAQQLCREAGIPNCRLVTCETENGEGHCILAVEGFVLDNREDTVVGREYLNYKWLKIQDYDGGWRAIK